MALSAIGNGKFLEIAMRARSSLRRRGLRTLARRGWVKLARRLGWDLADPYRDWIEEHTPKASDLADQRRWARSTPGLPEFALFIRCEGGARSGLSRTLQSLRRQTYPHWSTVILRDDNDRPSPRGEHHDYFGVVSAGDTLSPEALYEFARAIVERDPRPDALYCDEDRLAHDGPRRFGPVFKPSWSPEMLLGYHYTGRLTLTRRAVVEEVGGYNPELGVAAEWDLMLRLSGRTDRIARIPKCLYHKRRKAGRLAAGGGDPRSRAVLEAHLGRLGLEDARAFEQPNGTFRVVWPLREPPRVSVIIPTKDSPGLIRRCVEDLLEATDYPNKEIILVDNGSTDPETLALYEHWSAAGSAVIVPFDQPFNYSVACNLGAAAARGEYLLFLNNDVEVIARDWLAELVRWGQFPGVGVVGTKLVYPDGSIQHAGITLNGVFGSLIFCREPDDLETSPDEALFGTPNIYRNVYAVVGACQLVRRSLFEELGGYDERSLIACGDDILCVGASRLGYRNVYTPYAALVHHEGHTRGRVNPIDDMTLCAQVLRRHEYREDPYYHPELESSNHLPALPPEWVASHSEYLGKKIDHWTTFLPDGALSRPGEEEAPRARLRELTQRLADGRWTAESVGRDVEAATWFVIDVLREEGMDRRFPRALREGAEGDFCRWLCTEGVVRYRLPDGAPGTIRAAFASRPGLSVSGLIDHLGRTDPPFRIARLPSLITRLSDWLLRHGRGHGLSEPRVLWFLLELLEDPVRETVRVYLTNPDWQRHFPDLRCPRDWDHFAAFLRDRYHLDLTGYEGRFRSTLDELDHSRIASRGPLDRRDPRPRASRGVQRVGGSLDSRIAEVAIGTEETPHRTVPDRSGPDMEGGGRLGLNVMGHFCISNGLGTSATSIVESLDLFGVGTSCRDILTDSTVFHQDRWRFLGREVFDATLVHVQPTPYFADRYARAGLHPRRDIYKIAMWYWEFAQVPEGWAEIARQLDEVWAPTRFIGDALRRTLDVPVHDLMPGIQIEGGVDFDRTAAGVPRDHTLFLFIFNMISVSERKNPLGLIAAFRRAFRTGDKVTLLIKTANMERFPEDAAKLRAAAREAGVIILDRNLQRAELVGLVEACDCYVSLHRSEGLGLTMAEAMLRAKPVIATGYSGNLEFMDRSNSLLVGYDLRPIGRDIYPYSRDYLWAEPSCAEAAEAMRWVHEHPAEARSLGEVALRSASETLSMRAAGERFARRLRQIYGEHFGE